MRPGIKQGWAIGLALLTALANAVGAGAQDSAVYEEMRYAVKTLVGYYVAAPGGKLTYTGKQKELLALRKSIASMFKRIPDTVFQGEIATSTSDKKPVKVKFMFGRAGDEATHPHGFPANVTGTGGIVIAIGGAGSSSSNETPPGDGGEATASGGDLCFAMGGDGGWGYSVPHPGGTPGGQATAKPAKKGYGIAIGGAGGTGLTIGKGLAGPGNVGGDAIVRGDGEAYGGPGGYGGDCWRGSGGGGGAGGNAEVTGSGVALGGTGGNGGVTIAEGGGVNLLEAAPGGPGGTAKGGKGSKATPGEAGIAGKLDVK